MINVCFADRTFSSFHDMILDFKCGKLLKFMIKFMFFIKNTENTQDYIDSRAYKIISNDVTDDIIKDNSSIKTGVSKNLISNLNKKNFFDNLIVNNEKKTFLQLIYSKSEYSEFLNSIDYILDRINYHSTNSNYETNENLNKSKNYDRLTEENPHKDFDNVNINKDDSKVLINIKFFLEKFDSAGENILQINKLKNFAEKERFLNV